ncbi:MAG: hypothetical protein ABIN36_12835 [Ferruginibacter sp.]
MKIKQQQILLITWFCVVCVLACSSSRKLPADIAEGRINYHYISNYVDSFNDVKDYNYSIWYQDSCIVLQYVHVLYELDATMPERPAASMHTLKYVYLDLKNLSCQDYHAFDTSSVPYKNYKLKPGEILQWNFYNVDNIPTYNDKPLISVDTVFHNKRYKKFVFQLPFTEDVKRVVYMTDQYSQNLFHISLMLDRKYAPYRVIRTEDFVNGKHEATLYYEELSNKLTGFERSVFTKWKYNAQHTALPVVSFDEAQKIQ